MRVYLFFLSCVAFLQLKIDLAIASEAEDNINPFELARQLRTEICAMNRSQVQNFYSAQRDEENRDRKFPGDTASQQIYNQRRPEVSWGLREVFKILVPHLGRRLENVTLDLFTWCIFPLSTTMDIYGCINSTDRWGSPGFRALGFLDIMNLKNVSRPAYKRGRLIIDTSENVHLSVLRGALVSCTIRLADNSTIGVYYEMDLMQRSRGSTLVRISPQADAFLVEGQQKNFTCQSEGDEVFGYRWFQKTENGQYKYICEDVFTKVEETCNHTSFYQLVFKEADHESHSCELEIAHSLRYQSMNSILFFASPTVNDTGEMLCNSNIATNGRGSSIFISVVFTKLPPETVDIKEGSSSLLTCEMKAPSDSMVYWTKKLVQNEECQIPIKKEATPGNGTSAVLCNTTAVVKKTITEVDKDYSIFRLELQIPEANFKHDGTFFCNVKYKVGSLTEPQLIQQQSVVTIGN